MMKHFNYNTNLSAVLFLFICCGAVFAQEDLRKIEIGAFVSAIKLKKSVSESPLGIGGRLTYNINKYAAIDGEIAHFPQNPSGNFGESQAFAGVKAGIRNEKFGLFAKARPGFVRFGGDFFKVRNGGAKSYFAMDVGGVFEFYPNSRVIIRADVGDTIIRFGNDRIQTGSAAAISPGTTHNLQTGIGIGFRF